MDDAIRDAAMRARQASRELATVTTEQKNALLRDLADRLDANSARILDANAEDVQQAKQAGLDQAKIQRLKLSASSIERMRTGLEQIAALPDPVGEIVDETTRPNGLNVRRLRCPIGVIAMIYEARPSVTIDAFALCFKASNAVILKGGKEADRANVALSGLAQESLAQAGLPTGAIEQMTATSRQDIYRLLELDDLIDLVIPRGGEALIRDVVDKSRIPVVKHYKGVCHAYVHASAEVDQAVAICVNGKVSAPATCNALECVLIDRDIAGRFLPPFVSAMTSAHVELRGDDEARRQAPGIKPAAPDDYGREFLDLVLALRIVDGIDEAIQHIQTYGSSHTDAILTQDPRAAARFIECVQSSCVLVNASTRFNDGQELGLGAEIGISTQRCHAFGPMGLRELTVTRFVVEGAGQIRG